MDEPNVYLFEPSEHSVKWSVFNNTKDELFSCQALGARLSAAKFNEIAGLTDCENPRLIDTADILAGRDLIIEPGKVETLTVKFPLENYKICAINGQLRCQKIECKDNEALEDTFEDIEAIAGKRVEGSGCYRRRVARTCRLGNIQESVSEATEFLGVFRKDDKGTLYCSQEDRCVYENQTYLLSETFTKTGPLTFDGMYLNARCYRVKSTFKCTANNVVTNIRNEYPEYALQGYRSHSGKCNTRRSCNNGLDHSEKSAVKKNYCGGYLASESYDTCDDGKSGSKRVELRKCQNNRPSFEK